MFIFLNLILITLVYGFKDNIDNKYLVLSTSKFWFNIRQSINVLMIYQSLKDMGVSDDNVYIYIYIIYIYTYIYI
jgi:phosphatidylinositol glycan class K